MAVARSNWKEWARDSMRGLENVTLPSFKPDTLEIDEAGIRWDIRQSIKHGFFATMVPGGKRILDIAVDEAGDDIHISVYAGSKAQIKMAEQAGASHVTISFPADFQPETEDQIYEYFRDLCESTSLGVVLYTSERFDFHRFHPSGVPFSVWDRLVEIPNVMAMKVGFPEPGVVFECFRRYSDKIQVNIGSAGMVGMYPLLIRKYQVQWGGTGLWEAWQSPEKPYLVEFFDLVDKGRTDDAMRIFWFLAEANKVALQQLGSKHAIGGRDVGVMDRAFGKYVIWSVGGNGGPTPGLAQKLTQRAMDQRKAALRAIDIEPSEPDEMFFAGRVNYRA